MANNIIYHYCSVNTFYLIILNKCIRASDLNKTNDYMEKKWAFNLFLEIIQDELNNLGISINLDEKFFYGRDINSHRKFLKKNLKNYMESSEPILITCFSNDRDKLSQWRLYGQDGYGIAIGFDLEKIRLLQDEKNNIFVKDVLYTQEKQTKELSDVISSSVNYMIDLYEVGNFLMIDDFNEYFREEFDVFFEYLIEELEQISFYIKNPAFIEEKETRIIYDPYILSEPGSDDIDYYFKETKRVSKYKINPIRYYTKDDKLIAYSDIDFSNFIFENIITEIVLGPKSKLTQDDVFFFLLSNGYDGYNINIERSMASYR